MSGYQRIVIDRFGGPDELRLVSEPSIPEPGPGEVRVKVLACGVGYTDTIVRRGQYVEYRGGVPMTPGYDFSGTVDAVGDGVALPVGNMVADMPVTGSYAQYLIRPAKSQIEVPAGVNPARAVCIPLIWMTAWQMLTRYRVPLCGETVLVVGAAGSTGRALVGLARHLGLNVIGTCSSRDLAAVRQSGARPVDYRSARLGADILDAAGGKPVTMAFDAAAGESWDTSWRVLGPHGMLVAYGMESFIDSNASLVAKATHMARLLIGRSLQGRLDGTGRKAKLYNINARRKAKPRDYMDDAKVLMRMLAEGLIAPVIAKTLPLSAAAQAHIDIDRGGLDGRIILDPWQ